MHPQSKLHPHAPTAHLCVNCICFLVLRQTTSRYIYRFAVDSQLFLYYDNDMNETINKKKVTEEQIAAWVDEAEKGYDVNALKKRGRGRPGRGSEPSQVIAVRLTPEELKQLDRKAAEQNMTRSEFIRKSLTVQID